MSARTRSVLVVALVWLLAFVGATLGIGIEAAALVKIAHGGTAQVWGAYGARAFAWLAIYAPAAFAVVVTRRRSMRAPDALDAAASASTSASLRRSALTPRTERIVRTVGRVCDVVGVVVAGTVAFDVLIFPVARSTALKPPGASWRVGFRLMDAVMPSAPAFAIVIVVAVLLLSAAGASSLALGKGDLSSLRRALASTFFAAACAVLLVVSQWRGGGAPAWSFEAPALFVSVLEAFGVGYRVLPWLGVGALTLVSLGAGAAWLALSSADPPNAAPPSTDDVAAADLDVE